MLENQHPLLQKTDVRSTRPIDTVLHQSQSWWSRAYFFAQKAKIHTWQAALFLLFVVGSAAALTVSVFFDIESTSDAASPSQQALLEVMRTQGCVADGLLSDYGHDTERTVALINRSSCHYLHRALETWGAAPDFPQAAAILKRLERQDMIYGMFLAEAIPSTGEYVDPFSGKTYAFKDMCRKGSQDVWGKGTCKPSLNRAAYRDYVFTIAKQAIDLGLQSFLFGQVAFQEDSGLDNPAIPGVLKKIRAYADKQGRTIVIGAQTNDITNPQYLRLFDYLDGGVGIDERGNVEEGPCLARRAEAVEGWCWALLWHPNYAQAAKTILLHLDWSGLPDDDMSIFARMDRVTRANTLTQLKRRFSTEKIGFLLPYISVVYKKNDGCYGPTPEFYTPDDAYTCRDENLMRTLLEPVHLTGVLSGTPLQSPLANTPAAVPVTLVPERERAAVFVSQRVPERMVAGETYQIALTMRNVGTQSWTDTEGFYLGSQNPQDNATWGGRAFLAAGDEIASGETKEFSFAVTAPRSAGVYNFQWQMLDEDTEWFGDLTPNVPVTVIPKVVDVEIEVLPELSVPAR